jgi:AcrR family transcriptional regulator
MAAARGVFAQHGFQRVTMGDIAVAAGMSRPALYLIYPSKADVFAATLERLFVEWLAEVRVVLARKGSLDHRLRAAFDVWCVRPYELVLTAPDARDLFDSSRTFAADVVDRNFAAFEQLLAGQLAPLVRAQSRVRLPAIRIARLMVGAALGFKQSAADATHLRELIAGQITIVLASLR